MKFDSIFLIAGLVSGAISTSEAPSGELRERDVKMKEGLFAPGCTQEGDRWWAWSACKDGEMVLNTIHHEGDDWCWLAYVSNAGYYHWAECTDKSKNTIDVDDLFDDMNEKNGDSLAYNCAMDKNSLGERAGCGS